MTQGNYANTKILGRLMGILEETGQAIPDFMHEQARLNNVWAHGNKTKQRFGGNDARGGQARNYRVSSKGKGKNGKNGSSGSKGKGKGGGGKSGDQWGSQHRPEDPRRRPEENVQDWRR